MYWDEKWIYLEQKFYHKEKVMSQAYVKAVFLKKKDKVTPDEVMSGFNLDLIKPDPSPALKAWLEAEKIESTRITT